MSDLDQREILELELTAARRNGSRALEELHRKMSREIRRAERRALAAERRLEESKARVEALRDRVRRAEGDLAALEGSRSLRLGRVLTALPRAFVRGR
ncbi:hypothetical protein [Nocardioides sp.]|uniref:hypothetical protein n=1 Tax=Nocardioides sp. TaxID=35761 RepID=UPI003565C993